MDNEGSLGHPYFHIFGIAKTATRDPIRPKAGVLEGPKFLYGEAWRTNTWAGDD